jgi:hypothetical protein
MPSAKPKRGPCRHDQPDFVTIDFKHSQIFGKHGYTERARCFCGYSIRGAAYDSEPTGDELAPIEERMRRVIAQHGANHARRDAICTEAVFTDQLRRLNPPARTSARKLSG